MLADLDDLDFAGWKNPWGTDQGSGDAEAEAVELDPELGKVLTLRRLLETVADYPRRVELAIETKHPTRYGGLVEKRLVELLAQFGWAGADSPARVMSFSWVALQTGRAAGTRARPGVLDEASGGVVAGAARGARPDWIAGPDIKMVRSSPDVIRKIARQSRVHCWVVNTEADADLCHELGIEAVITDRPGPTLRYLSGGA